MPVCVLSDKQIVANHVLRKIFYNHLLS